MKCSKILREGGKKYPPDCHVHGKNGCPEPLTEDQKMAANKETLRRKIKEYLEKWYGEECPDFERSCVICQKYKLMGELLDE